MSFVKTIEKTMRGNEAGLLPSLLYPLSVLYGCAIRGRTVLYGLGVLPTHSLGARVVSVGNLTVGGTGKTPITVFLAEFFMNSGKRVAILSRGYGRKSKGLQVVCEGSGPLLGPEDAGDEPYLIAARLPGVPVVVCADRVKAGEFIMERFSPHVIILDDAFQHIRLKRDVNILLVDANEGFGNGHLLPRGILREPLSALKRADFALIKGGRPGPDAEALLDMYSIPRLAFSYRPSSFYDINTGQTADISSFGGKKSLALCGIARPSSFRETLAGLGVDAVKCLEFPDHHSYSKNDVESIEAAAKGIGAVVTTEKDGVKLKGRTKSVAIYALRIDAEMEKSPFMNFMAPMLKGVF